MSKETKGKYIIKLVWPPLQTLVIILEKSSIFLL